MTWGGRVRWMKAVEGVEGKTLRSIGKWHGLMTAMWDDIGGTENCVALYMKNKPRPEYATGELPETVGALVWFPARDGHRVADFCGDSHFEIGIPISRCLLLTRAGVPTYRGDVKLRYIVEGAYRSEALGVWKQVIASLTGGKPFCLDEKFPALADSLTDRFRDRVEAAHA